MTDQYIRVQEASTRIQLTVCMPLPTSSPKMDSNGTPSIPTTSTLLTFFLVIVPATSMLIKLVPIITTLFPIPTTPAILLDWTAWSIFCASSRTRSVNTLERSAPGTGRRRGVLPGARMSVVYGIAASSAELIVTSLELVLTLVTVVDGRGQ
jgi:hypothetical protein